MADAELVEEEGTPPTAGDRLREAREAAGLSLEDIATSTRIPTRHLESLESSDFARLPAPTYSIGFAKNYAAAVGLDRTEIGDQLRTEMGGSRPTYTVPADVFEPADPARAMPKWLIIGAIGAILVAVLLIKWLSDRALAPEDEAVVTNEVAAAPQPPVQTAPAAQGPVVITATDRVWVEIKDGDVILKQGELVAGDVFQVPANAAAPTLTTAKAAALRIAVGNRIAPMVGEPATKVTVSLKGEDLLRPRPAATTVDPEAASPPPAATPARITPVRRPVPPAATQPQPTAPATEPLANAATPAATPQQ